MFMAIVDVQVAATDRDAVLSILQADAAAARELPGNQSYRAFLDPETQTGIRIFHEWDSKDAFEGYMESEPFQRIGRELRPLLTAPPISRRFTADQLETQN
jgi:quinol monooxygenase YgiN